MPILADYHLHSNFSGDSNTPMESMIEKAIALGLQVICFTEHQDIDFPELPDVPSTKFDLNTDSYLYELLRLRKKYEGQIEIGFGVELGLQPHLTKELPIYARSHEFDFIIGSTHLCKRQDVYYPSYFEGRSDEEAYREYFEEVYLNIKKFQNFDVCGHLDYVVRYGATKDKDYCYEKYADIFDKILTFLIEHEKGIEVNTGGLSRGMREQNPCVGILKRYRELGGELITIGSDAHTPDTIGYSFDKVNSLLKELGFGYYCIYQNRIAEFKKLV